MDAHSILWIDTDIYHRRYEKTATALIAVERALRARRPLRGGEDEFLELYAVLAAADPDTFTTIWEDPFGYFWARLAYELAGWCLNSGPRPLELEKYCAALRTDDPQRALALHLEEFKRFIIALEMTSGGTRNFRRPFETTLPGSIPGTRFSVLGRGSLSVTGISGGSLEVIHNGIALRLGVQDATSNADPVRLVRRPIVCHNDFELILKPETFCVPGIEEALALLDSAGDFQEQQTGLLRDALALIAQHQPQALQHLCELVQVIAFKLPASGKYSNVSFSDLPGAFIVSAVKEPYWLADALVHETLHNRLFFVLDRGEILQGVEPGESDKPGSFYSPWRNDLRPLSGLLHAVYVYIGVGRFWLSVCGGGQTSGIQREYAEDQAVRAVLDLKIGIYQLRHNANFTEGGVDLFKQLERDVDDLVALMRALSLSPSAPATGARSDGQIVPLNGTGGHRFSILESIYAHEEQYDTRRQCDLKSILNLG